MMQATVQLNRGCQRPRDALTERKKKVVQRGTGVLGQARQARRRSRRARGHRHTHTTRTRGRMSGRRWWWKPDRKETRAGFTVNKRAKWSGCNRADAGSLGSLGSGLAG